MQDTFDAPMPRPSKANVLNLLWAYAIKYDGTKKARCVCNGNPRRKGTVTLAHTFAACLEQPGARKFWALSALKGFLVIGADAPKAPLYVIIDQQFREWKRSCSSSSTCPSGSPRILKIMGKDDKCNN